MPRGTKTTIELEKETHRRLKREAAMNNMSYDEFLNFLIHLNERAGKIVSRLGAKGLEEIPRVLDTLAENRGSVRGDEQAIAVVAKWRTRAEEET